MSRLILETPSFVAAGIRRVEQISVGMYRGIRHMSCWSTHSLSVLAGPNTLSLLFPFAFTRSSFLGPSLFLVQTKPAIVADSPILLE